MEMRPLLVTAFLLFLGCQLGIASEQNATQNNTTQNQTESGKLNLLGIAAKACHDGQNVFISMTCTICGDCEKQAFDKMWPIRRGLCAAKCAAMGSLFNGIFD